jgi:hypothetical protein
MEFPPFFVCTGLRFAIAHTIKTVAVTARAKPSFHVPSVAQTAQGAHSGPSLQPDVVKVCGWVMLTCTVEGIF